MTNGTRGLALARRALVALAFAAALGAGSGCSSTSCDADCVGGIGVDGDVPATSVEAHLCVNEVCAVARVVAGKCASTSTPTARFCLDDRGGAIHRLSITVQQPTPHDNDHVTLSVERYPDGQSLAHLDQRAQYDEQGDCACGNALLTF